MMTKKVSLLQRPRLFFVGMIDALLVSCDNIQGSLILVPLILILKFTFEQLFFVGSQLDFFCGYLVDD